MKKNPIIFSAAIVVLIFAACSGFLGDVVKVMKFANRMNAPISFYGRVRDCGPIIGSLILTPKRNGMSPANRLLTGQWTCNPLVST